MTKNEVVYDNLPKGFSRISTSPQAQYLQIEYLLDTNRELKSKTAIKLTVLIIWNFVYMLAVLWLLFKIKNNCGDLDLILL